MNQDDIMMRNSSVLDSITSSTRSSAGKDEVSRTLEEVARYLVYLHSPNADENVVDTLASGTILCDIVSDYIGSEFIDSYHNDAKRESIQAQENLHSFSAACEKMQIPLSCVATMKDFKERNYKKIELTLVLFVMRGFAYNLPHDESIMELLKNYQLVDLPEMRSKDHRVCENIIEVFRDKGNDKDIPVNTDSSDSESLPSEKPERKNGVIDEVNFGNEDKQEEEVAAPAAPAVPAPTGENNSDVEKPAEEEDAVDEHLPEEREETGARPSEVAESEEDAVDEHVQPAAPEVPAVPEVPEVPAVPTALEVPAVPEPAEEEDAVDEHLPAEPPAPAEEEDAVDEHTPEEPAVAPIALPEEPTEEEGARPSEVQDELQSPRELFPDEPEIITHSNLPPGWDIDPRSAPAPKPREHSHRHSKPAQPAQPAQPTQPTQPTETEQQGQSAEHKTELRSLDSIKKNVQVPKRQIHWYVVAILIFLMLVCLAGIVVSGIWLAKVNQ